MKQHAVSIAQQLNLGTSLTPEDLSYLEEYIRATKPVAVALDRLQGDETAFYGTALPTLYMVKISKRSWLWKTELTSLLLLI